VLADTVAIFGAPRCLSAPIPDREAVDSYASSSTRFRAAGWAAGPEQQDRDFSGRPRRASTGWTVAIGQEAKKGGKRMPLEISILDYGDIELESSFLSRHNAAAPGRVLTLGS